MSATEPRHLGSGRSWSRERTPVRNGGSALTIAGFATLGCDSGHTETGLCIGLCPVAVGELVHPALLETIATRWPWPWRSGISARRWVPIAESTADGRAWSGGVIRWRMGITVLAARPMHPAMLKPPDPIKLIVR